MLQPRTAKLYVKPIEETAEAFIRRIKKIRDNDLEVPEDFLNEIHKWSLECKLFCYPPPPYLYQQVPNQPQSLIPTDLFLVSIPASNHVGETASYRLHPCHKPHLSHPKPCHMLFQQPHISLRKHPVQCLLYRRDYK
jgi:hypothetical protein